MLRKIVLRDSAAAQWQVFTDPVQVLVATTVDEVVDVIEAAAGQVERHGSFAAGFVCYEAAPAFDASFVTQPPGPLPLAVFGVYRTPEVVAALPGPLRSDDRALDWRMDTGRADYRRNVDFIKSQIALGNTYQVNYTVRQQAGEVDDAWRLFREIAIDAPFAAYLDCTDFSIVSASPELFFRLDGRRLVCRPMKGTAARGMTTAEDEHIRERLQRSIKDRAENVMIADMVRNDTGRIAVAGSVRASSLFELEKYRTVWQMTSTIEATTDAAVIEIFRALFPSASITGAPKVSSMRLIAAIEQGPRQVYTGCIGFLGPGRQARFNVAIRTAVLDRKAGTAVYGVGGGIVWDSDAEAEYQECLSKAGVLSSPGDGERFALLETMLWTRRDGCRLLDLHLDRLEDSARYFDFRCDRDHILERLHELTASLGGFACCLRLLLDADGSVRFETLEAPRHDADTVVRLRLAAEPVDLRNPFLYHKTTNRAAYQRALAKADDCDDVLLWNERGELTESTIANVVVRLGDHLYTPPVTSGLLGGTLRRSLLAEGKIAERIVRVDEIGDAESLYLVNSVRGWRRAALIDEKSRAGR